MSQGRYRTWVGVKDRYRRRLVGRFLRPDAVYRVLDVHIRADIAPECDHCGVKVRYLDKVADGEGHVYFFGRRCLDKIHPDLPGLANQVVRGRVWLPRIRWMRAILASELTRLKIPDEDLRVADRAIELGHLSRIETAWKRITWYVPTVMPHAPRK